MTTHLSLAPLFRSSIGFDRFNELFESAIRGDAAATYPPYNVEKHGEDDYCIVVAAAGLKDADLDIQVERDVLSIGSVRRENSAESVEFLHQGIAQRGFKLSFRLADQIEVTGANLENGLLTVKLVRRVPEAAKPRRISIAREPLVTSAANGTAVLETRAA